MLFYKVVGMISDEKWAEENNDCRIRQQRIRQIARKSDEFSKNMLTSISKQDIEIPTVKQTAQIRKIGFGF